MRSLTPVPALLIAFASFATACGVQITTRTMRTEVVTYDSELVTVLAGRNMTLFPAFAERVEYTFPDAMGAQVAILSPDQQVEVVDSTDGQVRISAIVMAATPTEVASFKKNVRTSIDGRRLNVNITGGANYFCTKNVRRINGRVERLVAGTCLDEVRIELPPSSRTQVFYNGTPMLQARRAGPQELAAILRSKSSDSGRLDQLEAFAHSRQSTLTADYIAAALPTFNSNFSKVDATKVLVNAAPSGRFVTMSEVIDVLRGVSSSSTQRDICEQLSGRVVDPQNAFLVMEVIMSSLTGRDAAMALAR